METPGPNANPQNTPQAQAAGNDSISFKKKWLVWLAIIAILVFVLFFWHPFKSTPNFAEPKAKEPTYKRDEPSKPQIFQSDYEEKIRDLINEGKTVGEISNETGVSRKEIRRIKKEMGKGDSDN
ncbi:MAG: hypothetical protein U0V74_12895 [Chitinophagales bacterium]